MTSDEPEATTRYPVEYDVDYPERPLNRLTTFFRLIVVIPISIVLATVTGYAYSAVGDSYWTWTYGTDTVLVTAGGFLFAGPLLMILFRRKYPRWWFDWNVALLA